MAQIIPIITNGIAVLAARPGNPYYVQPVMEITSNGLSRNVLAGPAKKLEGQSSSGRTLVAGDTWADVTQALTVLGIAPLPIEPAP